MALSSTRDFLESGRPLGGELTNVTDLICSLIRSGVTANSLEALMVAPLVVPHLVSEPILLPSLLNAAAERMNSNGKTQSAALNLIDTSKDSHNVLNICYILYVTHGIRYATSPVTHHWAEISNLL